MGNNNSGHSFNHSPPPWSQSLPRDIQRQKRYGAMQGTKVLPERIPGQRLRPTENGRNLQVQGTITSRNPEEMISSSAPQKIPLGYQQHSTSMTALNHPPVSTSLSYQQHSTSIHDLRFGFPPSKSFLSEPDLRGQSPPSQVSYPTGQMHSIISQSPTKGKIKSKKKYKAPPPPPFHLGPESMERPHSVASPFTKEGWHSSTPPPGIKDPSKPRKSGLFKKKNESRLSRYDHDQSCPESKDGGMIRLSERVTPPKDIPLPHINIPRSSKRELKERTRSLDNLQHEARRMSPPPLNSSMHSLEVIGSIPPEDGKTWLPPEVKKRYFDVDDNRNASFKRDSRSYNLEDHERRTDSISESDSAKFHRSLSTVERKVEEKRALESRMSCPSSVPPIFETKHPKNYRRSTSAGVHQSAALEAVKDEWDKAEEEWQRKKKNSEKLQSDILIAAKNLRKTSLIREENKENHVEEIIPPQQREMNLEVEAAPDTPPKTFFFGMEPQTEEAQKEMGVSVIAKLNEQDSIIIKDSTVEYSRHSLKPKGKREHSERDQWNRSLDLKDRSKKNREREVERSPESYEDRKKMARKIDEFVATIERSKSKLKPSAEEYYNSLSRNGDGGYHSRQNSGSFPLENEASDDGTGIRMNLRPTLPRRQLELPRFSPNAAWRSLSVETSTRSKESHGDILSSEDLYVGEDQILRNTRPTAPPRGSGEKSGDSGISGDAGSPGLHDFEPITPEKIKLSPGPLAASSPIASQADIRRAWTPAQDLDDNSLEESGGDSKSKSASTIPQEVTTLPKLTSRSNMFSIQNRGHYSSEDIIDGLESDKNNLLDEPPSRKYSDYENVKLKRNEANLNSLQVKRTLSTPKNYEDEVINDDEQFGNEDSWRENWSLSRSIPNSLNNCDEPDHASNSSRPCRSRSESRMSTNMHNTSGNSRPITPSYMQHGNTGHIMYLPEYKSYSLGKNDRTSKVYTQKSSQILENAPSTPENERKPPSGDENPEEPDFERWNALNTPHAATQTYPYLESTVNNRGWRKQKKFSYQSTVRMMEKRKLEEKLSIEVEQKEERRLREVEAMLKVEEEFQKKREREKKRLKKQLKQYQKKASSSSLASLNEDQRSKSSTGVHNQTTSHSDLLEVSSQFSDRSPPPLPVSPPPPSFEPRRGLASYQSLPMEYSGGGGPPPMYERNGDLPSHSPGFFSGIKKWVKGKKEHKSTNSGYHSDASSATITSGSRQDPDGAPSSIRKSTDDFRAEIISASRFRNGTPEHGSVSPVYKNTSRSSGTASEASKSSNRRPFTPDSRKTISPASSRRSFSSETCQLTQELPEMKQERRQYREYRTPRKQPARPQNSISPVIQLKDSSASYNYRREFSHGNAPNSSTLKILNQDESDRYSRLSNDSRVSRKSGVSSKRSSSAELLSTSPVNPVSRTPSRRPNSSADRMRPPPPSMSPIAPIFPYTGEMNIIRVQGGPTRPFPKGFGPHVDGSPARFAQNLITPYSPNRGYRPVIYNSPPHMNVLRV